MLSQLIPHNLHHYVYFILRVYVCMCEDKLYPDFRCSFYVVQQYLKFQLETPEPYLKPFRV